MFKFLFYFAQNTIIFVLKFKFLNYKKIIYKSYDFLFFIRKELKDFYLLHSFHELYQKSGQKQCQAIKKLEKDGL